MLSIKALLILGYRKLNISYPKYSNLFLNVLESFRAPVFSHGPDKKAYNLGAKRNLEEVMGTRRALWPIPIFTSLGDGQSFPLNPKYETDTENHFESTSTSDMTP